MQHDRGYVLALPSVRASNEARLGGRRGEGRIAAVMSRIGLASVDNAQGKIGLTGTAKAGVHGYCSCE
jgi:hypothetical protein